MSNHKLSPENTRRLIEAINHVYLFSVNFEANPFVAMHLHQAIMHLEKELPKKMRLPVHVVHSADGFDKFVRSILIKKPVPINNFMKKEK